MPKTKRSILFFICCFLIVCLIVTSVFVVSKKLSQNQKQESVFSIPNNILQLTSSTEKDIIWSEEPNEIIINNNDGTLTKNIYAVPVKFTNSSGETQYVDTSMTKLSGEHVYGNTSGMIETLYPKRLKNPILISNENSPIEMQVLGYSKDANTAKLETIDGEDYVVYDSAFGKDTQLRYCNTYTGIKEDIILKRNISVNKFQFVINTNGNKLVLSEDKKSLSVLSSETEGTLYNFGDIYVYDSYEIPEDGEPYGTHYSEDNYYEIEEIEDSKYLLSVVVSKEFLDNPKTVYPVVVDPTVNCDHSAKNVDDTYTWERYPTTNYYLENKLRVGNYNGSNYTSKHCYTYVKYFTMPTIPSGSAVTSASFVVRLRSGQTTAAPCTAYRVINTWEGKKITWDTNPPSAEGTSSVNPVSLTTYTFDVTSIVAKWYNGTANDYGFRVAYTNENYADLNSFYSSDQGTASYSPALSITYTEPVVYDLNVDSVSSPINNGQYYLNDPIAISAIVNNNTNSAANNVPVDFTLINTDTNSTVNSWSRTIATIDANSTATVTIDNWSAQPGNYRLDVSVNGNQTILESNISNNSSSVVFNVSSNIYESYDWVSPTKSTNISIPYSENHLGARIQCNYGDSVVGVDNSTVLATGYNEYMGYYIILQTTTIDPNTNKNYIVRYTNLQSISVETNDTVVKGTHIGTVGVTGYVNIPSLYIDVNNAGVTQSQQMTTQNTLDPCIFW